MRREHSLASAGVSGVCMWGAIKLVLQVLENFKLDSAAVAGRTARRLSVGSRWKVGSPIFLPRTPIIPLAFPYWQSLIWH